MKMIDLAKEYRESAELLKGRINELKETLAKEKLREMDKLRIRVRIEKLSAMHRETTDAAVTMERYYDRRYRRNARFTI